MPRFGAIDMSTQTKKEIFWRNIEKARQWEKDRPVRELERVRNEKLIGMASRETGKFQNKMIGPEIDRQALITRKLRPIDLGYQSLEIDGVRYRYTDEIEGTYGR